ncbi:glucosamine-6-phosphate deaminase [Kwoniella heveanensis CBS 569]|nr:glucosamine-6-phosphate deaminase [Kwoniella heveanensis CBS 569]
MHLQTFSTPEEASEAVANLIISRINAFGPTQHHKFVLGLPTGGTPVRVYENLAERCEAGEISFEHVISVNLDEYVGLPPTHEQSYHHFMEEHFDIPPSQTHILPGVPIHPIQIITGTDPSAASEWESDLKAHQVSCAAYEALITYLGGINLLFMGIGANGHIGFNEPGSSFESRTRVVALNEGTREANARFFEDKSRVPTHALSMGLGTILDAQEIVVLALGSNKAEAIRRAVEDGINHMTPASVLQQHERVTFVADSSAASGLKEDTKEHLKLQSQSQSHSMHLARHGAAKSLITNSTNPPIDAAIDTCTSTTGDHGQRTNARPIVTLLAKGEVLLDHSEEGDEGDSLPGL